MEQDEKRSGYCPVHNMMCDRVKRSVPIWAFVLFIGLFGSLFGHVNLMVSKHVSKTNTVLGRVSHGLNEVALNQRIIMRELNLEFQHTRKYDQAE